MLKLQESEFLRDIAKHTMQIQREDGVYRHIRFSVPGSSVYRFDLLTWPGHLCYTGDMGTYVFQRIEDMFEFFRADQCNDDRLYTNHGYWSEKLVAVDGNKRKGAATEFSEEKFRRVINEYRVEWMRDRSLTKEQRRKLWESVDDEVLCLIDDGGGDSAQRAAYGFCWRPCHYSGRGPEWSFADLWDHNFEDYTHSFRWCCFALAWGIKTYDKAKEPVAA